MHALNREQYPALLTRTSRGKFHDLSSVPSKYGEVAARSTVAGIELLEAYERGELELDENGKQQIQRDSAASHMSCLLQMS